MTRRLAGLCVGLLALAFAAGAQAQPPTLTPPVTIAGPGASVGNLTGVSIARDGSGGLAYLESVGGVEHVFVSRLVSGTFQVPDEVDASFSGDSSQPVIGAGDNGLLLIAFINNGGLYVITRASATSGYSAPKLLATGASNPSIGVSIHEKGYLAFIVVGNGGHDVRAAYYYNGVWGVESSPLDANPADDAGVGTGAPRVAAAGDGEAIVVWGEAGHVYSRRVWGISPSVVFEQADPPSINGWTEVSADSPTVAAGDDSSFGYVAFHEVLSNGSAQQSRVLLNELRGSLYTGVESADGLATPGPDGAVDPQIALTEYDDGFAVSGRNSSLQVVATRFGNNGINQGVQRVDSLQNASVPYVAVGTTGFFSAAIAWQRDPGAGGSPEIRVRYYDASSFGPEMVASSPALGATNAADGLYIDGDIAGDMAIAWVQGTGAQTVIEVARLFASPGSFGVSGPGPYATTSHPLLSWSAPREQWGPLQYVVTIDGAVVGRTTATSLRVPTPIADGPHTWQVTALNEAGLATAAHPSGLFVDTFRPLVQLSLTGAERAGVSLRLSVRDTDTPPLLNSRVASGISSASVKWGDGKTSTIRRSATHAYPRPGAYRLVVTVRDHAGNATTLTQRLRIGSKPK